MTALLFRPLNVLSNAALTSSGTLKLTVAMEILIVEIFNNVEDSLFGAGRTSLRDPGRFDPEEHGTGNARGRAANQVSKPYLLPAAERLSFERYPMRFQLVLWRSRTLKKCAGAKVALLEWRQAS